MELSDEENLLPHAIMFDFYKKAFVLQFFDANSELSKVPGMQRRK
jgi:hypothetical protein